MTPADALAALARRLEPFETLSYAGFPALPPADDADVQLRKAFGAAPAPGLAALIPTRGLVHAEWQARDPGSGWTAEGALVRSALATVLASRPAAAALLPDAAGTAVVLSELPHQHLVLADVAAEEVALWLALPGAEPLRLAVSAARYAALDAALGGLSGWPLRAAHDAEAVRARTTPDGLVAKAAVFAPDADLGDLAPDDGPAAPPPTDLADAFDGAAGGSGHRGAPVWASALLTAELSLGAPLPAEAVAYYRQMNGATYAPPDAAGGGFELHPLEYSVGGPKPTRGRPWAYGAAADLGAPGRADLAGWLPFYRAEEQAVVVRFDPLRLAVADRDGVRPLDLSLVDFVVGAARHGGRAAWLRSLDPAYPDAPPDPSGAA